MTIKAAIQEIEEIISKIVLAQKYPDVEYTVSEPPKKDFGDLTCNICFSLSKHLSQDPYRLAKDLVENHINPYLYNNNNNNEANKSLIETSEPHQSGYINFRINRKKFNNLVNRIISDPNYGSIDIGKNNLVYIEHTSVNPNKAIHVGHLRNIVIGDVLYRTFKFTNHDVKVLNYIDDSGVQVADLIMAFKYYNFPVEPEQKDTKYDHYCGDVYVKLNELHGNNQDIIEKRKCIIKEIENGDSEISIFTRNIVNRILIEQLKTCWSIGARYDLLNLESQIILSKLWEKTFNILQDKKIIKYVSEGKNQNCWVIDTTVDKEEKVIIRSDGTATYIAKDIPFSLWKLGILNDPFSYSHFTDQWDGTQLLITSLESQSDKQFDKRIPEKTITIIDSRQSRLQNIISEIIRKIDKNNSNYVYLGYESVTLSSQTAKSLGFEIQNKNLIHMSGRKGIFVNADDIIEEITKKAMIEVKKRNIDFPKDEIYNISRSISISAIRYNLIKQDLDKLIIFDINESLKLDGDTSLYLQYSYARAVRILEKTDVINYDNVNTDLLTSEIEFDLIKEMSRLDMMVETVISSLSPKILARYSYRLATIFNNLYEQIPILKEDLPERRIARITLVRSFCIVMEKLFSLLGISILSKI